MISSLRLQLQHLNMADLFSSSISCEVRASVVKKLVSSYRRQEVHQRFSHSILVREHGHEPAERMNGGVTQTSRGQGTGKLTAHSR